MVTAHRLPIGLTRHQRRHRGVSEAQLRQPVDAGPLTFGFADPPYPGQSKALYGDHPDYAGEVDHAALIDRLLDEYPAGWALCSGSTMIPEVAELLPSGIRTMAWVKPLTTIKPGTSLSFGWEPVYVYGGRSRGRGAPMLRDWFSCSPIAWKSARRQDPRSVIGMKPDPFCRWVFEALGARPDMGDSVDDLFPGSGAVADAWAAFSSQGKLL